MAAVVTRIRIGEVSHIAIYPIKGAGRVELASAMLTPSGLKDTTGIRDREFMVVMRDPTPTGVHEFVTQRRGRDESSRRANGTAQLALVRPAIEEQGIRLSFNGQDPILVPRFQAANEHSMQRMRVGIWGKIVHALDQGNTMAEWLSDHIHEPVRVVHLPRRLERTVSRQYLGYGRPSQSSNDVNQRNRIWFQDGYPVHYISNSSLEILSEKVGEEVPWTSFRPNLVINGIMPKIEHHVNEGMINGVPFLQPKPCTRCAVPNTAQDTLARMRVTQHLDLWRDAEGILQPIFGENIIPLSIGAVRPQETMYMTAERYPPLVYGPIERFR